MQVTPKYKYLPHCLSENPHLNISTSVSPNVLHYPPQEPAPSVMSPSSLNITTINGYPCSKSLYSFVLFQISYSRSILAPFISNM